MNMNLILIKKDDATIKSDFSVSQYPVTVRDFQEIVGGQPGDAGTEGYIKKSTWMEAIRYCNLLNLRHGLPPAYDEQSGILIDENGRRIEEVLEVKGFRFPTSRVKGFRLPTSEEWEYAAKGWSPEGKSGSYLRILRETFKMWDTDPNVYLNGRSNIAEMETNTIVICGMLGNAREWYSDNKTLDGLKNKVCFWQEYFVNYDNDISYQVKTEIRGDADVNGFRVVLSSIE